MAQGVRRETSPMLIAIIQETPGETAAERYATINRALDRELQKAAPGSRHQKIVLGIKGLIQGLVRMDSESNPQTEEPSTHALAA